MVKKKSRLMYQSIARDIGRAKAFERPAHEVARKIQNPATGMPPIVDMAANIKLIRDLTRTHIAKRDDIGFDILLEQRTPPDPGDPVATWIRPLGDPIAVPAGQVMIIQSYTFWAEINNQPADPEPILAGPTELKRILSFQLKANGVSLQQNYYGGGFVYPLGGYVILSQSIAGDSNWDDAGNSLVVRGAARVVAQVERVTNLVSARIVMNVGCRLRGFFTQETGEEGVSK